MLRETKPNVFDRFFLIHRRIIHAKQVTENCKAFYCTDYHSEPFVYLKFSTAGRAEYHRIKREELANFSKFVEEALEFSETG